MMKGRWAAGFGFLGVLLLSGCQSWVPAPYVDRDFEKTSLDEAWLATLTVVDKEFDISTSDKSAGSFETAWETNLGSFRYEGKRRRVLGKLSEEDEGTTVSLRVDVETNTEMDRPLDIRRATWSTEAPDDSAARRLHHLIDLSLKARKEREARRE